MTKWNMVIDVALCENCNNCFLSTKDEHVGNEFPGYSASQPLHGHRWIDIKRKVRGSGSMVDAAHVPTMCNHCDDAPCRKVGGDAIVKRADGIVLIDPKKSKGRKDIVSACPYGAIWWNEELQIPQHWTFDAHLLDQGWAMPRGAHACPTGAMRAVKASDDEMARRAKQDGLEVMRPDLNTRPRIWYKNLHRYAKCFVGGSVIAEIDGKTECIGEATVELRRTDSMIMKVTTDVFGDFKFDRIEPDSGEYSLAITHKNYGAAFVDVNVGNESVYLGELRLT
jgi:Fe-S-cluster-containing dehydrogenase component